MKFSDTETKLKTHFLEATKFTYSDGSVATVCKKIHRYSKKYINLKNRPPTVNRNEPMTKMALKRTLNRYFEKLFELDLENEKCRFLTLTISKEKYNNYKKICERFKYFIGEVREQTKKYYLGMIRFIELQQNGFFHIHCILVFNSKNFNFTSKELQKIWGWGLVDIKTIKDRFGLFDYLTNLKHSATFGTSNEFTRYPKGARIIYISPQLSRSKFENISLSSDKFARLPNMAKFEEYTKVHQYFDPITQKVRTCIDRKILIKKNSKEAEQK